ncbi:hypothetical protein H4219_006453, partial [Mycoemilia scoparia]
LVAKALNTEQQEVSSGLDGQALKVVVLDFEATVSTGLVGSTAGRDSLAKSTTKVRGWRIRKCGKEVVFDHGHIAFEAKFHWPRLEVLEVSRKVDPFKYKGRDIELELMLYKLSDEVVLAGY